VVTRFHVVARSALALCDEAISRIARRLLRAKVHRPRNDICLFLLSSFFIVSCSTNTPPSPPQVVSVYSTFAAEPWLTDLYACADSAATLARVDDPSSADIVLQIGEQEFLSGFAYQIDEENIIVVTNNARPPVIDPQQFKAIFIGQITNLNQIAPAWGKVHTNEIGDISAWVFPSNADVQQVFDKFVLEGRPVISTAGVAVTPQEMLKEIQKDTSAIGFLPQRWNPDNDVFEQGVIATVPVLALTKSEPQGAVNNLIGCLQK
jgi:hypothetical protein